MAWEKISTIGATAGTDLKESDGTVLADNAIRNEDLSISQGNSGVLTLNRGAVAADTTTITKAKLNLSYDDGATVGATWGTNVGSRPTELTDGRVSTALTASGILDTTVPQAKGGTGLTSNATILNSAVDADHVGLGNVTNESKSTMFAGPTFTGTVAGVSKSHVGLSNVDNTSDATTLAGNLTGTIGGVANATVRTGAAAGATANQDSTSTILAGNLTGTIGGTANATVRSGAAAGATANQDSTSTILGGNLTGTVDGTAVATVKSGAAAGATANQDSTSTILGGNLTGTVDGTAVATVKSGAASGATANQDSTSTIRAGTTKANVGLSNVENTAVSTWAGSSNITTCGTIGTGAWQGTAVSTSYTDATDNGTTINTSGNIAGTVDIASGGSITVGNITIDGTNNRILITD